MKVMDISDLKKEAKIFCEFYEKGKSFFTYWSD